jgi:hypothetical protein
MPTSACELMPSLWLCLPPEFPSTCGSNDHDWEFSPFNVVVQHEQVAARRQSECLRRVDFEFVFL